MTENYFILLGLRFDPPETDVNKINEAIELKTQEWQKNSKNPKKAYIYKEYLQSIDKIREVMLNETTRTQEATDAKAIHVKKLKDVHYDILIKSTKGYLKEADIEDLYEKYSQFMITKSEIKAKANVPICDNFLVDAMEGNLSDFEVTEKDITNQLETYFDNMGYDNVSIYDFLEVKPTDDIQSLDAAVEEKLLRVLQKGTKTSSDEMIQKIAGIAKNIFSSEEEKAKYDNYLQGCQFLTLNRLLADGAATNDGKINAKLYQVLKSIIKNDFSMSSSDAMKYIITNIIINGYILDADIATLTDTEEIDIEETIAETDEEIDDIEEFDPNKSYSNNGADKRAQALDTNKSNYENEFIDFEDLDYSNVNPDDSTQPPVPPPSQPSPQQTEQKQPSPEPAPSPIIDDNHPLPNTSESYEYLNNYLFKKINEVSAGAVNEIYSIYNKMQGHMNKAINAEYLAAKSAINYMLIIALITVPINLVVMYVTSTYMNDIVLFAIFLLLAAGIIFGGRALFAKAFNKNIYKTLDDAYYNYTRSHELYKKEYADKDFNQFKDAETIRLHLKQLEKNMKYYLSKTYEDQEKFYGRYNQLKKPIMPFYMWQIGTGLLIGTVVIIALVIIL